MLKLKLQYFGHPMRRTNSFEKTLLLGKSEGRRRRDDRGWDGWMASPTQWTWVWVDSGGWWWTGRPGVLRFMGSQRVGPDWMNVTKWLAWVLHQDVDSVKHSYPSSPKQDKELSCMVGREMVSSAGNLHIQYPCYCEGRGEQIPGTSTNLTWHLTTALLLWSCCLLGNWS